MAIQSVPAFPWPAHNFWLSGHTSHALVTGTITVDSSADRIALLFLAPKTGTLDRMEFNVAGGTALQDLRAGWQNVDLATGYPDDTYDEYADISGYSAGWIVPAYFGASGGGSGAKRSVTQGDLLAFVISSTGAGPNITITTHAYGGGSGVTRLPSLVTNLTGSYTIPNEAMPAVSLYYDGETDATPINWQVNGGRVITTANISTGTPRQAGLKFTMPFPARCVGAGFLADPDADLILRLYDSATNDMLASAVTLDKDIPGASPGAGAFEIRFPSAITLAAGGTYRLVLENTTATNCALRYMDFNDNGDLAAWNGGKNAFWTQSDLAYASLVNEASWSDTDSRVPFAWLILDGLDDGAGGGGGLAANPIRGFVS